jgi:outer membrane protein assembly factor BamB
MKDGKPIPYAVSGRGGPSEIIATPVFWKKRVYVAIGQDPEHDEGQGNLSCIDATKTGDISKTGKIWENREIDRSMSTVSIDPQSGLLFIADFTGYVRCLDAETGKTYWSHDTKSHIWGSTLVADGKVYIGDESQTLTVLEASKEKKILSQTDLGAPIYSTPVVANGVLYVGTQDRLYAFQSSGMMGRDEIPKVKLKN